MRNIFNWAKGRFSGTTDTRAEDSHEDSVVADDRLATDSPDEAYEPTIPKLRVLDLSKPVGAADDSEGYDPYDTTVIMDKK